MDEGQVNMHPERKYKKRQNTALASIAQLVGYRPTNLRVAD